MKKTTTLALLTTTLLAPALFAWTRATHVASLLPESRLWVSGTSTVRAFDCKATAFSATIEAASPELAREVLSGQKSVQSVVLEVPSDKLDCANGTMNGHMLKAIKAQENPVIEFRLSSYDIQPASGAVKGKLNGTLDLGGVRKDITLDATAQAAPNGALHVVGSYELGMKDYGLKPPTLMMGALKVGNKVTVNFDLLVK